jgi:hypothetical protein
MSTNHMQRSSMWLTPCWGGKPVPRLVVRQQALQVATQHSTQMWYLCEWWCLEMQRHFSCITIRGGSP